MFSFRIFRSDVEDQATDFDLGDIEFSIDDETISSRGAPRLSNMIYLSICDLIYGLLGLGSKSPVYEFVGADSSYLVVFKKTKRGVYIRHNKIVLGPIDYIELLKGIDSGIDEFFSLSINIPLDSVDLDRHRSQLKAILSVYQ